MQKLKRVLLFILVIVTFINVPIEKAGAEALTYALKTQGGSNAPYIPINANYGTNVRVCFDFYCESCNYAKVFDIRLNGTLRFLSAISNAAFRTDTEGNVNYDGEWFTRITPLEWNHVEYNFFYDNNTVEIAAKFNDFNFTKIVNTTQTAFGGVSEAFLDERSNIDTTYYDNIVLKYGNISEKYDFENGLLRPYSQINPGSSTVFNVEQVKANTNVDIVNDMQLLEYENGDLSLELNYFNNSEKSIEPIAIVVGYDIYDSVIGLQLKKLDFCEGDNHKVLEFDSFSSDYKRAFLFEDLSCITPLLPYADLIEAKPVLDLNFDLDAIGKNYFGGLVKNYRGNNRLYVLVDSEPYEIKFDALTVGDFAISFDIAIEGEINANLSIQGGGTPASLLKFSPNGIVSTPKGNSLFRYDETFNNVIIAYHNDDKCFDIYARGSLVLKNYRADLNSAVTFDKCVSFAISAMSDNLEAGMYLDNIKVYPTYVKVPGCEVYHDGAKIPAKNKKILLSSQNYFSNELLYKYQYLTRPSKEKIYADFIKNNSVNLHPRVLANRDYIEKLKKSINNDPVQYRWYRRLMSYCNFNVLNAQTVKYELHDGVRLLYVSEEFTGYMLCLALAYQLTGDDKYFKCAWPHMLAVATMPDWNPSHHIDVGTMALGYSIAYDWFYDAMNPTQRRLIERGAYNNCLYTVNLAVESPNTPYGTVLQNNNHNVYCNFGVIATCMAFMDVYPGVCSKLSADVIRMLEPFLDKFAPDGAYFEGSNYASIAINYTAGIISVFDSCLGTNYGLDHMEGLEDAAKYVLHLQSDISTFNYGDGNYGLIKPTGLYWVMNHYKQSGLKKNVSEKLFYSPIGVDNYFLLLWYGEDEQIQEDSLAYDAYYERQGVITMRNGYDDGQVFVGIKAGNTVYEHSHLDPGSFVFDALGKRWAFDLGVEDYNLYYSNSLYDLFRIRPESHNVLLVGPDSTIGYELGAKATVSKFSSTDQSVIALLDTSELYGKRVSSAKRGFYFADNRNSLVVRDEITTSTLKDIYWLMYIDSNYKVSGNTVILTDKQDNNKGVKVEFVSSKSGSVVVEDAIPFPSSPQIFGQTPNTDYKRLYYKISSNGRTNITVKITPLSVEGSSINLYDVDMAMWKN